MMIRDSGLLFFGHPVYSPCETSLCSRNFSSNGAVV